MKNNKLLLCILDGWGFSPSTEYNAIYHAKTDFYDGLLASYPNSLLHASGLSVGVPHGQMGNSEVGHMTIGSGRIIDQDLVRINKLIKDEKKFNSNQILDNLVRRTGSNTCHILALVSDGGVHSHIDHIIAIGKYLKKKQINVVVHAFTDGRDTAPKSAVKFLKNIEKNGLEIVSISGRFYAMDRDNRWHRTEKAYQNIFYGTGIKFDNTQKYVTQQYNKEIYDEFIEPAAAKNFSGFKDGDSIFIGNYRADRILQLIKSILAKKRYFQSQKILQYSYLASISQYDKSLNEDVHPLLEKIKVPNYLGKYLASLGKKQLRIAETEKYAHVTYFFNCADYVALDGEDRVIIPSPKVDCYDEKPEMSAFEVTSKLLELLDKKDYDFTCVNFANADMVGHTGNFSAAVKACEAIDLCLEKISNYCLSHNIDLLITADHGNIEEMYEKNTNQPKTSHSVNNVPLIYVGRKNIILKQGQLSDIAPTILKLLNMPIPQEMTGKVLI